MEAKKAGICPITDAERLRQEFKEFRNANNLSTAPRISRQILIIIFGEENIPVPQKAWRAKKKNQVNHSISAFALCSRALRETEKALAKVEKQRQGYKNMIRNLTKTKKELLANK